MVSQPQYIHYSNVLPKDQADWVGNWRTTSVSSIHSIAVTLTRQSQSQPWGFVLKGGWEHKSLLIITKVNPNTPSDGKLAVGEVVRMVNGIDVTRSKHIDAVRLIKNARKQLVLTISRDKISPNDFPKYQMPNPLSA